MAGEIPDKVNINELFESVGIRYFQVDNYSAALNLLSEIQPRRIVNTCMGGILRSPMANDITASLGYDRVTLTEEASTLRGYRGKMTAISQFSFIQALFSEGTYNEEEDLLYIPTKFDQGFDCICWFLNNGEDPAGRRLMEALAVHLKALLPVGKLEQPFTIIEITTDERDLSDHLPEGKSITDYYR